MTSFDECIYYDWDELGERANCKHPKRYGEACYEDTSDPGTIECELMVPADEIDAYPDAYEKFLMGEIERHTTKLEKLKKDLRDFRAR